MFFPLASYLSGHMVVCQQPTSVCGTQVGKSYMRHTSMLFTRTAESPFLTPHISITTGPISIKFTYFMPFIYTTLHTKFEENRISSLQDMHF